MLILLFIIVSHSPLDVFMLYLLIIIITTLFFYFWYTQIDTCECFNEFDHHQHHLLAYDKLDSLVAHTKKKSGIFVVILFRNFSCVNNFVLKTFLFVFLLISLEVILYGFEEELRFLRFIIISIVRVCQVLEERFYWIEFFLTSKPLNCDQILSSCDYWFWWTSETF